MKVAILHEMLVKLGGAEKVVSRLIEIFPDADLFTLLYDEEKVGEVFPKDTIHPQVFGLRSQKIYKLLKKQRLCLLFMAQSVEQLDFSKYDLVIASSSGFAHGAITKPETKFVVYSHSPARYLWDWTNEYKKDIGWSGGIKGLILNKIFLRMRTWDYIASSRADMILANSQNTKNRIQKYHRKTSHILYPPVETNRFAKSLNYSTQKPHPDPLLKGEGEIGRLVSSSPGGEELRGGFGVENEPPEYYVIISALTEFKKIDVAVKAFKDILNANLVVIGQGEYSSELQKQSGENTMFVGPKYGDELVAFVQNSLGLIFPGEEDFGIVPIEVMAAGKPIFALRKGGLTETVLDGKTGAFFDNSEGSDFVSKFQKFHSNNQDGKYKSDDCIQQASQFSEEVFEENLKEYIDKT